MTAYDIIKLGLSHVYDTPVTDVEAKKFSLDVLQTLVVECFESEQNSREVEDAAIPNVTNQNLVIPYNDYLCRVCLPYGVAWKYAEANNLPTAAYYQNLYEDARHIAGGAKWVE